MDYGEGVNGLPKANVIEFDLEGGNQGHRASLWHRAPRSSLYIFAKGARRLPRPMPLLDAIEEGRPASFSRSACLAADSDGASRIARGARFALCGDCLIWGRVRAVHGARYFGDGSRPAILGTGFDLHQSRLDCGARRMAAGTRSAKSAMSSAVTIVGKREPEAPVGPTRVGDAQRGDDVRGPGLAGLSRQSRWRRRRPSRSRQHDEKLAVDVMAHKTRRCPADGARGVGGRPSVARRVRHPRCGARAQSRNAARRSPRSASCAVASSERSGEALRRRLRFRCPRACRALGAPPRIRGGDGEAPRADRAPRCPRGPVELMSRERERIDAEGGNVDRDMADRLHGVGVKGHARRAWATARERRHVLNRADLVVGEHDRDKGGGRRVDAARARFSSIGRQRAPARGHRCAHGLPPSTGQGRSRRRPLALQGLGRMPGWRDAR